MRDPISTRHALIPVDPKLHLMFAAAILGAALLFVALTVSRGQVPVEDREQMVTETLSNLVYGVRNELPGLVMSCFADRLVVSKDGAGDALASIESFLGSTEAPYGLPRLYLDITRISWRGDNAIVDCRLVWNTVTTNGYRRSRTERERFVLSRTGDRYVISEASVTKTLFSRESPEGLPMERKHPPRARGVQL